MFFHGLVAFFTGPCGKEIEWDSELIFFRRVRITFFHDLNCGLVFRRVIESEQLDIRMLYTSERRTHHNSEFGIKTSKHSCWLAFYPSLYIFWWYCHIMNWIFVFYFVIRRSYWVLRDNRIIFPPFLFCGFSFPADLVQNFVLKLGVLKFCQTML